MVIIGSPYTAVLACLWVVVSSTICASAQSNGGPTFRDVSLFVMDQNNVDFDGIPDQNGEALETLEGYSFLDRGSIAELNSDSQDLMVSNLDDLPRSKCHIPNEEATRFIIRELSPPGRRLHQCLPWFSHCGALVPATAQEACTDVVCPPPPPPPPRRPVFVSICVKQMCFTFDIPNHSAIFQAGQETCPDTFAAPEKVPEILAMPEEPSDSVPEPPTPPEAPSGPVLIPSPKPQEPSGPVADPPMNPKEPSGPLVLPPPKPQEPSGPVQKPPTTPEDQSGPVAESEMNPQQSKGKLRRLNPFKKNKRKERSPANCSFLYKQRFALGLCNKNKKACKIEKVRRCKNGGWEWRVKGAGYTCKCKDMDDYPY